MGIITNMSSLNVWETTLVSLNNDTELTTYKILSTANITGNNTSDSYQNEESETLHPHVQGFMEFIGFTDFLRAQKLMIVMIVYNFVFVQNGLSWQRVSTFVRKPNENGNQIKKSYTFILNFPFKHHFAFNNLNRLNVYRSVSWLVSKTPTE